MGVKISVGFTSYWMAKWHEFLSQSLCSRHSIETSSSVATIVLVYNYYSKKNKKEIFMDIPGNCNYFITVIPFKNLNLHFKY